MPAPGGRCPHALGPCRSQVPIKGKTARGPELLLPPGGRGAGRGGWGGAGGAHGPGRRRCLLGPAAALPPEDEDCGHCPACPSNRTANGWPRGGGPSLRPHGLHFVQGWGSLSQALIHTGLLEAASRCLGHARGERPPQTWGGPPPRPPGNVSGSCSGFRSLPLGLVSRPLFGNLLWIPSQDGVVPPALRTLTCTRAWEVGGTDAHGGLSVGSPPPSSGLVPALR